MQESSVPASASGAAARCPAAHAEDPRPCEGPADAVRIVDRTEASLAACVLHGAVLLASLEGGRVYPLNGSDGSAIEVYSRARSLPPFDFMTAPRLAALASAVREWPVVPGIRPDTGSAGGAAGGTAGDSPRRTRRAR